MILAMRDVAGHARVPLQSLHTIYTRTSFLNRCAGGTGAVQGPLRPHVRPDRGAAAPARPPVSSRPIPYSVGGAMGALRIRILDGRIAVAGEVGEIALQAQHDERLPGSTRRDRRRAARRLDVDR